MNKQARHGAASILVKHFVLLLGLSFGVIDANGVHTQVRLILASDAARPGDTVQAAIRLEMEPGWHTYWNNPGGSGMATSVKWDLPKTVTAGEIRWPVPEKALEEDFTTYVYNNTAVLLLTFKIDPAAQPGAIQLKGNLDWLECEAQCIPGSSPVSAALTIGSTAKASDQAPYFPEWEKALPRASSDPAFRAWWGGEPVQGLRPLIFEWDPAKAAVFDFFPGANDAFEVQGDVAIVSGKSQILKHVKKISGAWPESISGLLVQQKGREPRAYEVKLGISAKAPSASGAAIKGAASGSITPGGALPLWKVLLYAFIGGLILNIMPCVLPVLALKILGFVKQANDQPGRVRKLGVIYALGVMVSFLGLALLMIGVKAAGSGAGWGMQFGNPVFLVIMTLLVTLVALNLFGLFEVNLSGGVMDAAGNLASNHGSAGAFFHGMLATILATPCTAPFLSVALGFALVQRAPVIILTFLTIGFGLALPYLVLSWHPAWLRFLPRPGAWMERFKTLMGFPMLATAIWLASVLPSHYGSRSWWVGIFLVLVAMAAWIFGQFVQRGRSGRGVAGLTSVLILAGGYFFILERQVGWRSPLTSADSDRTNHSQPAGLDWQPWSPEAVAAARAQGRIVLVDFTAKWCVTCNAIVKPALEQPAVIEVLKKQNAVTLLGDYTKTPADITAELNRFDRAGVPLVLIYPADSAAPAIVLPDPSPLRSPSHYAGVLLEALKQAGTERGI